MTEVDPSSQAPRSGTAGTDPPVESDVPLPDAPGRNPRPILVPKHRRGGSAAHRAPALPPCRRRPTLLIGKVVCQADGLATRWPILSAGRSVSHVNRHAGLRGDAASPTIRFMTAGCRSSPRWSRESGDRSRWVRAGALVRVSEEYTLHEHYQRAQRHHDELHR